jgi:hypothetical protein
MSHIPLDRPFIPQSKTRTGYSASFPVFFYGAEISITESIKIEKTNFYKVLFPCRQKHHLNATQRDTLQ